MKIQLSKTAQKQGVTVEAVAAGIAARQFLGDIKKVVAVKKTCNQALSAGTPKMSIQVHLFYANGTDAYSTL